MKKEYLCGLTLDEIAALVELSGSKPQHAWKLAVALYHKRAPKPFTGQSLPLKMGKYFENSFESGVLKPFTEELSADASRKYLFRSDEGKLFECVYIPEKKRHTVCVSTQSGCRMGCDFCVTGKYGFHGNLTAREIISQVIGIPEAALISHVVFMGMGEPLDNLSETLKACRILTAPWGLALSHGNVTVSTVGIYAKAAEFIVSSNCNLTLSLYSPFREERITMIPAERLNPALDIIELMKNTKTRGRRRFTIAYMMIDGLNDSAAHLLELKRLLGGSSLRVNLLPYHHGAGTEHKASADDIMKHFRHELTISGIQASIRKSRGEDISAACGLLASGFSSPQD
jgi:23S rRNA (adenine2503-C2)-methyltransferase